MLSRLFPSITLPKPTGLRSCGSLDPEVSIDPNSGRVEKRDLCVDPGSPLSREIFSEAPGCFWKQGRPVGVLNLIQREQEGLGSELGWNFVQFLLREFRMVLGRTFKGHPVQFLQ